MQVINTFVNTYLAFKYCLRKESNWVSLGWCVKKKKNTLIKAAESFFSPESRKPESGLYCIFTGT